MSNLEDVWYLMHFSPPMGMGRSPTLFLTSPKGEVREVTLYELEGFEFPLVTHSFTFLVDWFRQSSLRLPTEVIDIEAAKKLLLGRPKSEFCGDTLPWDLYSILLPYLPSECNNDVLRMTLSTHLTEPKGIEADDVRWMRKISNVLPDAWREMRRAVSTAGEEERLLTVEIPTYQVMLQSQLTGIFIDESKRDAILSDIETRYIDAHYFLAVDNGINVTRAIQDSCYLADCLDLPELSDARPSEIIESLRHSDPICSRLHDIISARRNKSILLRTFSIDGNICYPTYDLMGTVTGRILVSDPQLQYLRKIYRSILVPRPDTEFIYVDYSHFEPTIMASICRDPVLTQLCNGNDIYTELAVRLFDCPTFRRTAKTLFLAYSYGMGRSGMVKLVARTTGRDQRCVTRMLEERFFNLLTGVDNWRETLSGILANNGRIGTALGNHRYRSSSGELTATEKRWASSQVVQGTGALILKKLICQIDRNIPEAKILLPMHDALLIEVPTGDSEVLRNAIVDEFIIAFQETCTGIQPQVSLEPFARE